MAEREFRRERANHTLQPTAIVHELFLKLSQGADIDWRNRAQFFAFAAQLIRHILVDHARESRAVKRGGGAVKLTLDAAAGMPQRPQVDVVALDDALQSLSQRDPQQGLIVELRFFAGLSIEETAAVLDISPATVKRDWSTARAWLFRDMTRSAAP